MEGNYFSRTGNGSKSRKIDEFFTSNVKSLEETISRMTSKDGLTFRVFTTSDDLRRCLRSDGFSDIPTSANTIRRMVINYSKKVQEKIKAEIKIELSQGSRFCITFDEWTSSRNRRYMNLILHGKASKIWNLGLVRCKGSMSAERCLDLVITKIESYNLSMEKDIVSIMTDGASVMIKLGKLSKFNQQLCFAHGIQLAVIDVLYKKKKESGRGEVATEDSNTECDSEDDECDDCDEFEIDDVGDKFESNEVEIVDDFKSVIDKARKIVKMFKNSALKNEVLQKYVKTDFKRERQLKLDTKTRWNSLANMLERFHELRNCIEKALVDIDPDLRLEQRELKTISDIVETLKPVQLAVEALCRRDSNLVTADAIIIFALEQLHKQTNELSRKLFNVLKTRISERRTDLSSVLQYLHSGDQQQSTAIPELRTIFDSPSKRKVEQVILNVIKRCHPQTLQVVSN